MRCMNSLAQVKEIIDTAISLGVSYIETCNFYIDHQCETLAQQALAEYPREKYELAAKFCFRGDLSQYNFEEYFNQQLITLQTDYIDYYLFQALDRTSFIDEQTLKPEFYDFYNFLQQKQQEGIVKYIGFSFHDMPIYLETLLKEFKWDFCQLQLNYYDWYMGCAKQLYYLTEEYDIPVFVMGALKGGKLGACEDNDPELAYKFLSLLPNIKLILNGATGIEWINQNNEFINNPKPLTKKELKIIQQIIADQNSILCTGCNYCKNQCTQNIDIAKTFQLYNKAVKTNDTFDYLNYVKENQDSVLRCLSCHKCEQYCPQHLPIAQLMHTRIFQLRL